MSLGQLVDRWQLGDERIARRIVGRLVEAGWLRRLEYPMAKFGVWSPTPRLIVSVTGRRVKWQARRPLHPLAVTATLAGAELAGWSAVTDMELARMVSGFNDPDRLDVHPWTITLSDGRRHLPDLVLTHPDVERPVAVEVELTRKEPERMRRILDGFNLDQRYGSVWYVTGDDVLGDYVTHHGQRIVPPIDKLRVFVNSKHWTPPALPTAASMTSPPAAATAPWPAPSGA